MSDNTTTHLLSPLDHHAPRVYTRTALIFPITNYEPAVRNLEQAISRTCTQLPFLRGTVHECGPEARRQSYITYSPTTPAPALQEITIPSRVHVPTFASLKKDRRPFPAWIFPSVAPNPEKNFEAPVLAVSYTKIPGGLVFCFVAYHKVLDGGGYGEILRVIAENARMVSGEGTAGGLDADDIATRRTRLLGGALELPNKIREMGFDEILERHPEYALKSRQKDVHGAAARGMPKAGAGVNEVFAFSKEKLEEVRAALAGKLPVREVTLHNIQTAIIWTSVTCVRMAREGQVPASGMSKMDFSVSGRKIIGQETLRPPYLGNCLGYALTELPLEKISFIPSLDDAERLVPIIHAIAAATKKLDIDFMHEIIELSNKNPDLTDLIPAWFLYGPYDLHFTSWAQIDVYELDFGPYIGKPEFLRTVVSEFDGIVTFLPRKRVEGVDEAIEASILLNVEDMERLKSDAAWQSWLFNDG